VLWSLTLVYIVGSASSGCIAVGCISIPVL
jgi:hypothetical protein